MLLVFLTSVPDCVTLLAVLISLPEHLDDVHRRSISLNPLRLLLESLLGEGEAGQLALHLWPTHQ
jgi:hypothetical protein